MFEVPIADVVEIVPSNSVQSRDLKLRRIRPNFSLFLEHIDHFDLPLYLLFNSCSGGAGDDLGDVVCEDDVSRRLRIWLGYVVARRLRMWLRYLIPRRLRIWFGYVMSHVN